MRSERFLRFAAMAIAGVAFSAHAAPSPPTARMTALGAVSFYTTLQPDTLLDVARRHDLGYTQLIAANPGVDPWLPGAGRRVVIPAFYLLPDAPHRGIVVNLAEQRLFYFPPDGGEVQTFPIGIGVVAAATPTGTTRVVAKEALPTWYPPPSIRAEKPGLPKAVPPGPDNPLGDLALRLGWKNYLIHGTNKPDGIGRRVSHGCLHLYPADIETLFAEVSLGTPVRVVDQRVEVAWTGDQLYVEVHPSQADADAMDIGEAPARDVPADLARRVLAAAGAAADRIDWRAVTRAGRTQTGIPTPLLRASDVGVVASVAPAMR